MDMPTTNLAISVNLGALTGQLQLTLQRAMNLVAIGLQAGKNIAQHPLVFPDTAMFHQLASNEEWTPEFTAAEWKRWTLRNGFRDAAEAVNSFFEEVQGILAVFSLQIKKGLTGADWNDVVDSRMKRFHRLGLPDKINFMDKQYGFRFDPVQTEQVYSVNSARNCLVHRNGVVTDRDVTDGDKLILKWTALTIILVKDGVETQASPPCNIEAGTLVSMGHRPRHKEFAIGEHVDLDADEFAQICRTLSLFGASSAQMLEQFGRSQGVPFNTPAQGNTVSSVQT
jgi:hypothetical protein